MRRMCRWGTDAIHQHTPTAIPRQLAFSARPSHQKGGHRAIAQVVPRGGVVNARRPGRRPGRSEAKSIDGAEHGASMKCAMVRQRDLDPQRRRSFRETLGRARADFCAIHPPLHPCGSGYEHEHAGGAFVVHDLCGQTARSGTTNDDGGTERRLGCSSAARRGNTGACTECAFTEPPGVRERPGRVPRPGGQADAIFASPPSWPTHPGPSSR